jgi:hypothetical protein
VSRRAFVLVAALLAARGAAAAERLGIMAVGDPPGGPDPDVTELAHQLRAVCRDRVGGIEEVSTMRARLLGQESGATVSELDRAYGGALAVYQSGEFESAFRTLKAIIADLESLPESDEVYEQWVRAVLRLAHTALTMGSQRDVDAALLRLARTDLTVQPDPDQYSPSYRRRLEELKGRVRALPRRKLVVTAEGREGTVFVNGRRMGTTPVTLTLPAGTYRIGGGAGGLRVPSFTVDLEGEDRSVVLDFALAGALRVNAGPGLALHAAQRAYGIIRAGAWLGLDRLIVVSRVDEGQAHFLLGSMYDVRRGALLREGSVRMVAGGVPSVNLSALAAFLLTGQGSREVKDRTQDGPREIVPPLPVADEPPPAPEPVRVAVEQAPAALTPAGAEPPGPVASPKAAAAVEPRRPPPAPSTSVATAPPALQPAAAETPRRAPSPLASPAPAARPAAAPVAAPAPEPSVTPRPALAIALPPRAGAPAPLRLTEVERGRSRHPWMRPAAIGGGVVALGLAGLAIHQGRTASTAYSDASALVLPDGNLRNAADRPRYYALRSDGDAATRNMYVSAGAAAILAGTAAVLGWRSFDVAPAGPAALALSF